MNRVKTRNLLILMHLFLAAFLAPSFILVAVTGAMDLAGIEADITETKIDLPDGVIIDPDRSNVEADITAILSKQDIDVTFESLRIRPEIITTRPTSSSFVRFKKSDNSWTATLNEPGLQYSMMELHKGHGPAAFKTFQMLAGIALFLVIIGGLIVGLLAKAYRRKTVVSFLIGSSAFLALAFGT